MINCPPRSQPTVDPGHDLGYGQQQQSLHGQQQQSLQQPLNVDSSRFGNMNTSPIPELTVTRPVVSLKQNYIENYSYLLGTSPCLV